jgi:pyridoxal phosphate enzyme (YggS family)
VSAVATAREAELAASLAAVRERLARAATAAGRNAADIELLPITKFFPASDVLILHQLGCREFGESREQEAAAKIAEVDADLSAEPIRSQKVADVAQAIAGDAVRWHMVGRIQRNKARRIAGWAFAAHSVDDARVVAALDRGAAEALDEGRRREPLRVYLQISLDGDTERGGVDLRRPDLVDELAAAVDAATGLAFVGLMAIPPLGASADEAFAALRAERDRVQRRCSQPLGLSAGMSGDLVEAVRHGSTCVRVGTALMGQRPLASP